MSLSAADEYHLDYELLEGFVDGTLSGEYRDRVMQHISECVVCRDSAEDLKALKLLMASAKPDKGLLVMEPNDPAIKFHTQAHRQRRIFLFAAAVIGVAVIMASTILQNRKKNQIAVHPSPDQTSPHNSTADAAIRDHIAAALKAGEIDQTGSEITSLKAEHNDILGASRTSFTASGPIGTAIRGGQPVFSWTRAGDATSYVVTIKLPRQDGFVSRSGPLTELTWKPDKALPRGVVLAWQVEAVENDRVTALSPTFPAHFMILSAAREAQVEQEERLFSNDPLSRAMLYSQFGLVDDAMAVLKTAQASSPSDPIISNLIEKLGNTQRIMQ